MKIPLIPHRYYALVAGFAVSFVAVALPSCASAANPGANASTSTPSTTSSAQSTSAPSTALASSIGVPVQPHASGAPAGVKLAATVTYLPHSGYSTDTCSGNDALQYSVLVPPGNGPFPVVFGSIGTGFKGSAECQQGSNPPAPIYQGFDYAMADWAAAGYVAVNIEYDGMDNGLFGNAPYPGAGNWGTTADATVEYDIKPAIGFFLNSDPSAQDPTRGYHADPHLGIVVTGSSSGAHNAYMVAATGVPNLPAGEKISAVVGYSGLPDVGLSEWNPKDTNPEAVFDRYMQTSPGTDTENFGDPYHRISASEPPQYVANGLTEFISPKNATAYAQALNQAGVPVWLRIPNTCLHAWNYAGYVFTGKSPEMSAPPAQIGTTVFSDSEAFAAQYVHGGTNPVTVGQGTTTCSS